MESPARVAPHVPQVPVVAVHPWHPLEHPHCETCRGLSRPVRRRNREDLVQLRRSDAVAARREQERVEQDRANLRSRLNEIVYRSQLPKERVADLLHINAATLWRMMTGKAPIRFKTAELIRSIEHIERDGRYTHVIYNTGTPSSRWEWMKKRRTRERNLTLHTHDEKQCEMKC